MLASGFAAKGEDLTVYLQNTATADFMTLVAAKGITSKMFGGIDVRIRWELGDPRKTDGAAIAMQFDSSAPARFRSDALAYATPFDDTRTCIHIFYNRVLGSVPRKLAPGLLGHVMAHEITHVLQRTEAHSATGVMKAQWTLSDYQAMSVRPLAFEAENIEAIRGYWSDKKMVTSR
ncbi:hypothetical protein SBA3_3250003 [Candidatus Sulfopaludibacter sp. SbA3]|nr:hypothetical protein SBA3_3250003 [Candidatus Sulfopaludibacter sp. SbA3]